MNPAYGEKLVVWRRPARDRHGDTSYVEHHDVEDAVVIYGDSATPNPTGIPGVDRPMAVYDAVCYCPVGADVLASDIVELPDGLQYHVIGRPLRPRHPRSGRRPALIVRLRRIEG